MLNFNQVVAKGAVLLAVDSTYNDNDGDVARAVVWFNSEVIYFVNNGYTTEFSQNSIPQASKEDLEEAKAYMEATSPELFSFNKYCYGGQGANTYIDCVVVLQRSRKAPNKTPLKVVDFEEESFNSFYNNTTPERVAVMVDGVKVWVSTGCIKEVIKGVKKLPFWCN